MKSRRATPHKPVALEAILAEEPTKLLFLLIEMGRAADHLLRRIQPPRVSAGSAPPTVAFRERERIVVVNGIRCDLAAREFALMSFLVKKCNRMKRPWLKQEEALSPLGHFLKDFAVRFPEGSVWRQQIQAWCNDLLSVTLHLEVKGTSLRRVLSTIRGSLIEAGLGDYLVFLLPHRQAFSINVKLSAQSE